MALLDSMLKVSPLLLLPAVLLSVVYIVMTLILIYIYTHTQIKIYCFDNVIHLHVAVENNIETLKFHKSYFSTNELK